MHYSENAGRRNVPCRVIPASAGIHLQRAQGDKLVMVSLSADGQACRTMDSGSSILRSSATAEDGSPE